MSIGTMQPSYAPHLEGDPILLPDLPYQGLTPFYEDDAPYFYGRERERELIIGNLRTARLTLLYGTSGVGKSSVLRAGVAETLRRRSVERMAAPVEPGERPSPGAVVVVFSSWRDHPVERFLQRVEDSARLVLGDATPDAPPHQGDLADTLAEWTRRLNAELFLVLDQFEEFLLYHGTDDRPTSFGEQLARVVNRDTLRVHTLISIREDALAQLDRFKGRIFGLFRNYLRLEHLTRESARDAILKPVETFNRVAGEERVTVEPDLVDQVLDQVSSGRVLGEHVGQGALPLDRASGGGQRVETPYLQLVMTRLWQESVGSDGRGRLTDATLARLGGAERIVLSHLDAVMEGLSAEQRDCAARMFRYLVTPSGTKIALSVSDLAELSELSGEQVSDTLEQLGASDAHVTRAVETDRHEIFHDVMAPAILDWRRRWIERQREDARVRRARINGILVWVAAGVLVVGVQGVQWFQRQLTEPSRDSVLASLGEFGAPLGTLGYTPVADDGIEMHQLAAGDSLSETLSLPGGADWAVVGACDQNCGNVDLRLFLGDRLVAADTLPDRRPIVRAEGTDSADYRLVSSMVDCDGLCLAGHRLYRRSPGEQVAALLQSQRERLENRGFQTIPVGGVDTLAADARQTHPLPPFEDTADLTILGLCDGNCRDLDLALLQDGEEVDFDRDPDDNPLVTILAGQGGAGYALEVSMANCLAERCAYGWQVYRSVGLTRLVIVSAMDAFAEVFTEGGYRSPIDTLGIHRLSGETTEVPLSGLEPGGQYSVVATCGPGCEVEDLALLVLDGREPVASGRLRRSADAAAVVADFTARPEVEYRVSLQPGTCQQEECNAGVRVFRWN